MRSTIAGRVWRLLALLALAGTIELALPGTAWARFEGEEGEEVTDPYDGYGAYNWILEDDDS